MERCALCGTAGGGGYITSLRGNGKEVCTKCLDELNGRRGIEGEVKAVHRKLQTVAKAAQKGVQTFKDELNEE